MNRHYSDKHTLPQHNPPEWKIERAILKQTELDFENAVSDAEVDYQITNLTILIEIVTGIRYFSRSPSVKPYMHV